jgi:hypothetical protein
MLLWFIAMAIRGIERGKVRMGNKGRDKMAGLRVGESAGRRRRIFEEHYLHGYNIT